MRRISIYITSAIIIIILLSGNLGYDMDYLKIKKAENIAENENVRLYGVVKEVLYVNDEYYKLVIEDKKAGKVLLGIEGRADERIYDLPGRIFKVYTGLSRPDKVSNPGEFNYDRYLRSEGIYLTGKIKESDFFIEGMNDDFINGILINKISNFKNKLYEKLKYEEGEVIAGLFCGMLFGEKERLSDESYESFRENGTAHILSVSGLHVGVIYGFINLIMGKRRRSPEALILTISVLISCTVLASFSISVMRAVFMIGLHIVAERIHCRYDMLSAAFFTAGVFLIINPEMLYSTGFILSFSAVVSLSVIGNGMNRIIKSKNTIIKIFLPIIAIQLGTAPINAHIFNYFSFASFISNIPVIFISSIVIPVGIIVFILFLIGGAIMPAVNLMCDCWGLLGEMMVFFNDITGAYGRLSINVASPSIALTAAYYLILFFIFSEFGFLHPFNKKKAAILVMGGILLFPAMSLEKNLKPEIVFLDIGQGDCIHIRTDSGENYLIDGGGSMFSDYDIGEKVIYKYLLKNGVDHLDGVFISHMDDDHYKGTASLNKLMDTGEIYLYSGYEESEEIVSEKLNKNKNEIYYLNRGDKIKLGEKIIVEVIYPEAGNVIDMSENEGDMNELSMVLLLNYNGRKILFTGDIGESEKLLSTDYSCDIIKVPHHGSKYSSSEEFIENANPKAGVIQVGKNNYGHPAESVIERYLKKGIILFRNDEDGAIKVYISKKRFIIKSHKSGEKYEF